MENKELRIQFSAPLNEGDTESQTFGCRQNNPDICGNNGMPGICAFVCDDHICRRPSRAWKKQCKKLKNEKQQNKIMHPYITLKCNNLSVIFMPRNGKSNAVVGVFLLPSWCGKEVSMPRMPKHLKKEWALFTLPIEVGRNSMSFAENAKEAASKASEFK